MLTEVKQPSYLDLRPKGLIFDCLNIRIGVTGLK